VTGVLTLLQPTAPNAERWVEDLRSAQRRLLAREGPPGADGLRWHFREDVLAWADGVLAAACPTDVLIVDELGPLELIHGAGWWRGATLALRGAFELAIVAVRPALVDRFVDRMTTDHAHVDAVIAPPAGEQWLEQWVEAKERRADPGVSH
jgi:nucleoside-triphosphatase THEP1